MEFLIIARILQGAAGAFLVPGSLSIITASFKGEEQGRAFGVWAGASAATSILGPFLGGVLVNTVSWRAAFLINLPFLAIAYYATVRYVPESRDEEATGRFDWLGSIVIAVAVGGLAFGTIRGQQQGWGEPAAIVSLVLGAAAAIAFPFMMLHRPDPLVPPKLFRSRNFTVTNLSTFVIYGALYVGLTFEGIFMIGTLGYNEQAAGIAGVPGGLFLVLFSARFGRLAARYGPRLFMSLGPAVMALGLLWFVRLPADSQPWVLGTTGSASLLPPEELFRGLAARARRVRHRPHDHGGAADDGADDVGLGEQRRRRLRHQQRDLPSRLPARQRPHLRRHRLELLRGDRRARPGRRHVLAPIPKRGLAAERARPAPSRLKCEPRRGSPRPTRFTWR